MTSLRAAATWTVGILCGALMLLAVVAFALIMLSAPANTQERNVQCGPRLSVIAALTHEYSEGVAAQGVTAGGWLLEVLAAPKGNWTIIITRPSGIACVAASGESWQPLCGEKPA